MSSFAPSPSDPSNRLRRLVALRWVAVVAELGLVLLTRQWLGTGAALEPVLAVCTAQLGLNLASIAYGRASAPASDGQLFAQLLFDTGALTAIAYLAGGSTNPLIGLYLLWIAVGAAMLEARLATALAAVSIACYSLVNFVHADVHIHDHEKALETHLVGMWLIFVFSAITICWSVVRLTAAVRRRDAELAAAREAALRNERVVALGNLAAGAAHELGTPLATMAVLAGELLRDSGLAPALRADVELMQAQVRDCKRIITELAAQAGTSRAEALGTMALDAWIEQLLGRWRVQRPVIEPQVRLQGPRPGPRLAIDATLGQALVNLFNNAADASPEKVEIQARWSERELELLVMDRGSGIAADLQQRLGHDLVSTRGEGHGMGLVLAFAAIERSGGQLEFAAREGGGTVARLRLPLQSLLAPVAGGLTSWVTDVTTPTP
ncbi:Sensor histidine kinase [Burkholderiales bacterium]|nr:Sensor histidine kinase [Burkholderiales bacterium]